MGVFFTIWDGFSSVTKPTVVRMLQMELPLCRLSVEPTVSIITIWRERERDLRRLREIERQKFKCVLKLL